MSGNNLFRLGELSNCLGTIVPKEHISDGVADSDLHVYVSFADNESSTLLASAALCFIDPLLNRPTFASIILNASHFKTNKKKTHFQFFSDLNSLTHEIIHILGFSPAVMPYWMH